MQVQKQQAGWRLAFCGDMRGGGGGTWLSVVCPGQACLLHYVCCVQTPISGWSDGEPPATPFSLLPTS